MVSIVIIDTIFVHEELLNGDKLIEPSDASYVYFKQVIDLKSPKFIVTPGL